MKTIAILLSLMFALQSCSLTQYKSVEVPEPPALDDTDGIYKTYDANALDGFITEEEDALEEEIVESSNPDKDKDINWMEEIGVALAVGLVISLICWLDIESAKDSGEYQLRDPTINPYNSTVPSNEYNGCFVFDF